MNSGVADRTLGLYEALAQLKGTTKFIDIGCNIGLLKESPERCITIPAPITPDINAEGFHCGVYIEEAPDTIANKPRCLLPIDLSKAPKFTNPISSCVLAISSVDCYWWRPITTSKYHHYAWHIGNLRRRA